MPRGTDGSTGSSRTGSTKRTAGQTQSKTVSGVVPHATDADTLARSSPFNAEAQQELMRLRTDSQAGHDALHE